MLGCPIPNKWAGAPSYSAGQGSAVANALCFRSTSPFQLPKRNTAHTHTHARTRTRTYEHWPVASATPVASLFLEPSQNTSAKPKPIPAAVLAKWLNRGGGKNVRKERYVEEKKRKERIGRRAGERAPPTLLKTCVRGLSRPFKTAKKPWPKNKHVHVLPRCVGATHLHVKFNAPSPSSSAPALLTSHSLHLTTVT